MNLSQLQEIAEPLYSRYNGLDLEQFAQAVIEASKLETASQESKRLDWLLASGAHVAYSRDGESCWLHRAYAEDGPLNQEMKYYSPRAAIDAAMLDPKFLE